MRSTALTLTVAAGIGLAMSQAASAADMPRKAPVMPVQMAYDWSGFYIGAHVGAGWSQHEVSADELAGIIVASPQGSGFLGGGQVGFNIQSGPVVWGVEVDGSWSDIHGSSQLYIPAVEGTDLTGNTEGSIKWLVTATARLGFTFDRTLVYVKGGAAWAKLEYSSFGFLGEGVTPASATSSTDKWGWTIGAGIEHAFTQNWSAKLEYNYIQFDKDNVSIDYTIAGSTTGTYDLVSSRENVHLIKFGLNYKFTPWSAPVTARY